MVRVTFFSYGLTGAGHIALALSIYYALKRCCYTTITYTIATRITPFARLAEELGAQVVMLPEDDTTLVSPDHFETSLLYKAIAAIAPDILIVDMSWFAIDAFIARLPCKKVFITRQVDPRYFSLRLPARTLSFRPGTYDLIVATEPGFDTPFESKRIEPIVMRNRGEILPLSQARTELGIKGDERACLFAFNGKEGEGALAWKSFSYLEEEGWRVVRSDNRSGGLFPAVDWFEAFELLVCGAGYSAFWEARAFEKQAFFVPFRRNFEDQSRRIAICSDYVPKENGADRLVDIISAL